MADINYEELEDLTLTMEDEDGTTTELRTLSLCLNIMDRIMVLFVRQRMKPVSFISSPIEWQYKLEKEKPS